MGAVQQRCGFARDSVDSAGRVLDRALPHVVTSMRIDVHDTQNRFDDQTRAYAEYRVFSALAALADVVHEVGVGLAQAEANDTADVFACSVSIRMRSGRSLDVASQAQHPYQAIERAAHQVAAFVNARADAAAAIATGR